MQISVINLWTPTTDCAICGKETLIYWFLPMWEGRIIPDDSKHEWGGMPVCKRCFTNPPPERVLKECPQGELS